jgi:hypothetical protein
MNGNRGPLIVNRAPCQCEEPLAEEPPEDAGRNAEWEEEQRGDHRFLALLATLSTG